MSADYALRQLTRDDLGLMRGLLLLFGQVFEQMDTYVHQQPSDAYLSDLLARDHFLAVVAVQDGAVVGGLTVYELRKYEQPRSELYIHDLAVAAAHRRRGIATALIGEVQKIAVVRGAHTVVVQADTAPEDEPAIALYSKLGRMERVLHFDIPVDGGPREI